MGWGNGFFGSTAAEGGAAFCPTGCCGSARVAYDRISSWARHKTCNSLLKCKNGSGLNPCQTSRVPSLVTQLA